MPFTVIDSRIFGLCAEGGSLKIERVFSSASLAWDNIIPVSFFCSKIIIKGLMPEHVEIGCYWCRIRGVFNPSMTGYPLYRPLRH